MVSKKGVVTLRKERQVLSHLREMKWKLECLRGGQDEDASNADYMMELIDEASKYVDSVDDLFRDMHRFHPRDVTTSADRIEGRTHLWIGRVVYEHPKKGTMSASKSPFKSKKLALAWAREQGEAFRSAK